MNSLENWSIIIPILFASLALGLRAKNLYIAPTRGGSRTSDILAYESFGLIVIFYLSIAGIVAWFELSDDVDLQAAKTDLFYGRSEFVINHLISPMVAYQGWNCIFSLLFSELRTVQMLVHHLSAALLSSFGLDSIFNYWAIYFFGLIEISNIPLTIINILRLALGEEHKKSTLYSLCKYAFALSFVILRLCCWPYFYVKCVTVAYDYYISGKLNPLYFYVFLPASSSLTILQYYWGYKIIIKLRQPAAKSD